MAVYSSYAEVPWFRKNWFILLGFLIFAPATLYSLFTGDIFYEKNGQLVTYSKTARTVAIVVCSGMSLRLIGTIFGME